MGGGHKVSTKQNLLASFSYTLFNWSGWNLTLCWSSVSQTCWFYFWVRLSETRDKVADLLTTSPKINISMHSGIYDLISFKFSMIIGIIIFFILILILVTLISIQGHRSVRNKNFCTYYLTKFSIDLDGTGLLLWLVGAMKLKLISLSRLLNTTFWYQFGWFLSSFKITVVWKIKNFCTHFLANFSIDLDEI